MDLSNLTLAELKRLNKDVLKAIEAFPNKLKTAAIAEIEAKAAELGFSIKELFVSGAKTRKKRVSIVKYRNPENPSVTWTGSGRRPKWVAEALASGKSLSDLAA